METTIKFEIAPGKRFREFEERLYETEQGVTYTSGGLPYQTSTSSEGGQSYQFDLIAGDKKDGGKTNTDSKTGDKYSFKVDYLHEEDFEDGDLDTIAPGTYLEVIRPHKIYLGESLFGWTEPQSGYSVVVRGDLRGTPMRKVRGHEVYHWTQRAGEAATRDATGTHMDEFLPLLERSKLRYG